ncbi:hypothetical protein, partial [Serratia marcescens]|uniref:hypothetical protein n=1 Tax=Serratia marcescens TaxID=615 RepID=UPI001A7E1599
VAYWLDKTQGYPFRGNNIPPEYCYEMVSTLVASGVDLTLTNAFIFFVWRFYLHINSMSKHSQCLEYTQIIAVFFCIHF